MGVDMYVYIERYICLKRERECVCVPRNLQALFDTHSCLHTVNIHVRSLGPWPRGETSLFRTAASSSVSGEAR